MKHLKIAFILAAFFSLAACGEGSEDCAKGSFGSDARACKTGK